MKTITQARSSGRLALALLATVALAAPSHAADFYLVAKSFTKTLPGSVSPVTMWGFAQANSTFSTVGPASSPGPWLTVPVGDPTLTIHLRNDLAEPTSVVVTGLPGDGVPTWNDNSTGPRTSPSQRVRSFTHETAPGAVGVYSWTGVKAGSYLYASGTHPSVQVQMGLYGGLLQDSAAGLAYPGVSYVKQVLLFYSEIDPALHQAVADGSYGTGAYTSTLNYRPTYFLVNGDPYPGGTPTTSGLNPNDRVLLRFFNAGLETHVPSMLGSYMSVVAEDGNRYSFARDQYSVLLAAGTTADAVFVPSTTGTFSVFDRTLDLTNASAPGGGFLSYLSVGASGTAPVAVDDAYTVAEDNPLAVAAPGVLANDTGSGLTAVLVSSTPNGTLTLNTNGSLAYVPRANFNGTDLFTYRAHGTADSNLATVRITVTPVNDPPVTVANSYNATAGTPLVVAVPGVLANDTDVDGNALTSVLATGPAHALAFSLNASGSFSYTGACVYAGADTFTYRANDGTVSGNLATVTLNVAARVNKAPVAVDDTVSVKQNTTSNVITVLANDSDPDAACSGLNASSVAIVSVPNRGGTAVAQSNGTILYTPKRFYRGTETFTYRVRDNNGAWSNTATVRVNVTR
jgi:FtsP/CotA-like multicopper oxidase with cupredoxin domain